MVSNNDGEPVKILQISDTHLFAKGPKRLMGVDTAWTLGQVVSTVVDTGREHDAVLVTGDLSQDESAESYRRLAEILAPLKAPVYCLPGNHDQGRNAHAGRLQPDGNIEQCRAVTLGNWQIILLNTAERKRVDGHLDDAEIEWLDSLLGKNSEHAVIAMHHQPVAVGSKWMDSIALDNAQALFSVLYRHKHVRLVIWGHVHQRFEDKRDGVQLMSCPSTCVQFKPNTDGFTLDTEMPGFRWLKLYADGRIDTAVERISSQEIGLDKFAKGY